ncbi:hypothetical protein [Legionella fallonii]|uniref:Uncharacterized protein n=1 Tax=Legionella fallonii LLAP-10 TaxID=1212491 RepID=A0A098G4T7_9GAMM|nr:hypothetical protein [Legionella fallonii]CEG57503.1 conserved protein of unknown function [Legionella fallonii LLAP-10]
MSNNEKDYTPINIETLILVAVWAPPFIFQGSFKIIDKKSHTEHLLFYRCQSEKTAKTDILEHEFSPYDYQLTHLYCVAEQGQCTFLQYLSEDALYLLKYAFYVSLTQMIRNDNHYPTYMDEVALMTISKRVGEVLKEGRDIQDDAHLGFAVAMDFNPTEPLGQAAVISLLSSVAQ